MCLSLKKSSRPDPMNREFSRYRGGRARVRECVNTMCARLTFAAASRAEAARPRSIFAKETDSCVCAPSKSNARAALTR